MPPLGDSSLVDDVIAIPTVAAKEMARRLAREKGLFAVNTDLYRR
jgi:cysteine synthase